MTKKLHWARTPAGKKHMAKMRRASAQARRRAKKGVTHHVNVKQQSQEELPNHIVAFAAGHILCWIETHARSHRVSATALTHRLGKILQQQASG